LREACTERPRRAAIYHALRLEVEERERDETHVVDVRIGDTEREALRGDRPIVPALLSAPRTVQVAAVQRPSRPADRIWVQTAVGQAEIYFSGQLPCVDHVRRGSKYHLRSFSFPQEMIRINLPL